MKISTEFKETHARQVHNVPIINTCTRSAAKQARAERCLATCTKPKPSLCDSSPALAPFCLRPGTFPVGQRAASERRVERTRSRIQSSTAAAKYCFVPFLFDRNLLGLDIRSVAHPLGHLLLDVLKPLQQIYLTLLTGQPRL